MNNEQDKPLNDARVRDAYRALATEKAPEALNQRVLESAAEQTTRAGRSRLQTLLWMKPAAWAAIIGLCLAIALEVTRMSEVYELDGVVMPMEPASAPQADALQKPASRAAEPPTPVAEEEPRQARPADATRSKLSAPKPAPAPREDTAARQATAFTAEMRSLTDASPACDAAARQSATAWRVCIEGLRDAGDLQAAKSEYEAFTLEYPEIATEFRPDK